MSRRTVFSRRQTSRKRGLTTLEYREALEKRTPTDLRQTDGPNQPGARGTI